MHAIEPMGCLLRQPWPRHDGASQQWHACSACSPAERLEISLACRYGWFVLIVEMLGATSTITYGLNIIFDPVHEPLEYEADAPGITKVRRPFLDRDFYAGHAESCLACIQTLCFCFSPCSIRSACSGLN